MSKSRGSHSRIDIILGCMFSGKSTELLRRCQKATAIGKRVLLINHSIDTRNPENVVQTHAKEVHVAIKTDSLLKTLDDICIDDYDVIGVDEAQFFGDLYEFVCKVELLDKHLILSGLDGDIHRKPFGQILQCIPMCDTVVKLHAYDMIERDFTPAIFSIRINNTDDRQIAVGASESYMAVSRSNYLQMIGTK